MFALSQLATEEYWREMRKTNLKSIRIFSLRVTCQPNPRWNKSDVAAMSSYQCCDEDERDNILRELPGACCAE